MDAAGMGEGVFTDDGLAALHHQTTHARDETGTFQDFARVHAATDSAEEITPRFEGHGYFLEGGIAGALADAIDGAFNLTGAGADCGEGVGDRQPQVIMAMHADDRLAS